MGKELQRDGTHQHSWKVGRFPVLVNRRTKAYAGHRAPGQAGPIFFTCISPGAKESTSHIFPPRADRYRLCCMWMEQQSVVLMHEP